MYKRTQGGAILKTSSRKIKKKKKRKDEERVPDAGKGNTSVQGIQCVDQIKFSLFLAIYLIRIIG